MKIKFLKTIAILLTVYGLNSGCTEFLDLPPSNQRAVDNFTDLKVVFAGYLQAFENKGNNINVAYSGGNLNYGTPLFEPRDVMMFEAYSDNIDFENSMSTYLDNRNPHVTTEKNKYYGDLLLYNVYDRPTELWNKYYSVIGFLNGMENRLEKLEGGTEDERNQVSGEIYVHRAYHFFKLLQWFAPYQNAELGIPVYLNTGENVVGVKNPRKPQSAVYNTILNDLNNALQLYEISRPSSYNQFYNKRYIHNLLAQVYWFKAESAAKEPNDYQNAKKYAQLAIQSIENDMPKTNKQMVAVWNNTDIEYPGFFNLNRESAGLAAIYGSPWFGGYHPINIPVKSDFAALFDDTDFRKSLYFQPDGKTLSLYIIDGEEGGGRRLKYNIFTPENAYLILAEATFRLGDSGEALTILNNFKTSRNATLVSDLSGENLLNEIKNERRKEFFTSKDMRWLDLKRYGTDTITRSINVYGQSYSITVEPNNFRYALPIPLLEIRENPDILPNEGWTLLEF